MEGPSEFQRKNSVYLSNEQAQSLEHVASNVSRDPNRQLNIMRSQDGRYFYEIKKNAPVQAVIATLLKGIVPVCDIKRVEDAKGTHYYSYVVPMENEKENGESTDEIEADREVIDLLFHGEHEARKNGLTNIRLDENHQAVYYDFDRSNLELKPNKESIERALEYTLTEYPAALPLIRERLQLLRENLDGPSGEQWFVKVLEHAGYDPLSDRNLPLTYQEYEGREERGETHDEKYKYRVTVDELLSRIRTKIDVVLEVLSGDTYQPQPGKNLYT
jgi:hypothetical protein